jgi:hypothetical protein
MAMTPATNAVTMIVSVGMSISHFAFDKPRIHSNHTHVFHLAQRRRYSLTQDVLGRQTPEWISLRTMRCGVADAGVRLGAGMSATPY